MFRIRMSTNLCFFDLVQQELVKIRYRWTQSDTAADNDLDLDEFLIFRHPEITGHSFKYVVDDIIVQMGSFLLLLLHRLRLNEIDFDFSDRNDDRQLTENEFAFLPCKSFDDVFFFHFVLIEIEIEFFF